MSSNVVSSQRLDWLDYARAIGITLIVLGHANRSIDRSVDLVWSEDFRILDSLLYSFHVPLFFLLAGVAASLSRPGWRHGGHSILLGLVVPYIIWSVIWISSKVLLPSDMINAPLAFDSLWRILWSPVGHFWFLYHLAVIRVIWLLAESLFDQKMKLMALVVLCFVSITLRGSGQEWSFVAHFVENTVYFGFGLVVLRWLVSDNKHIVGILFGCVAVFLVSLLVKGTAFESLRTLTAGFSGAIAVVCSTVLLARLGQQ